MKKTPPSTELVNETEAMLEESKSLLMNSPDRSTCILGDRTINLHGYSFVIRAAIHTEPDEQMNLRAYIYESDDDGGLNTSGNPLVYGDLSSFIAGHSRGLNMAHVGLEALADGVEDEEMQDLIMATFSSDTNGSAETKLPFSHRLKVGAFALALLAEGESITFSEHRWKLKKSKQRLTISTVDYTPGDTEWSMHVERSLDEPQIAVVRSSIDKTVQVEQNDAGLESFKRPRNELEYAALSANEVERTKKGKIVKLFADDESMKEWVTDQREQSLRLLDAKEVAWVAKAVALVKAGDYRL